MNAVVGASGDAALIHHQRLFVSAITAALTVPGMCLLLAATCLLALTSRQRLLEQRWLIAKLVLLVLIVLNGSFVLAPLVGQVTELAVQSAAQGQLLPAYPPLKSREDMFGIANFLMLAAALLLAVYKPGAREAA
ncbi:DUF2269 family protein [Janthinobacterium fluminis]|uniref:DUF2269 family protein n=1 Tax=Janthinobacterium fluminis TaxID=2987524 RepID=A0ABT5JUP0_9BURK|nr:DUF2269 family protein [Janthinobacterium fluminis]MDC8756437.1 DUF2269 family protein [Janthinobacterium fluminis]